jgi:hypothetical protein
MGEMAMIKRLLLLASVALLAAPIAAQQPAPAQPGPPVGSGLAPTSLDAAARSEVVSNLGSALRQRYVFPETGERAAARIDAALAAGEYDRLSDPTIFAARLTADVAAVANDKHLAVNSMSAPPPPPPAGALPRPRVEAGIVRADRLAGEVGYIEVVGFPAEEAFKPVVDRAMAALRGSKALIIDMRRNGGGDPNSVAYLTSFLVASGTPTHLNDIVTRVPDTTDFVRNELLTSPTPVSFAGRPVFVLTSRTTFSGGEGLAYGVQALKLGKVIGEVTGGGANPAGPVPLGNGLMALVPFGRAENPVTKTNWEGAGVQPDVPVPAADALKVALEGLGQEGVPDVAAASREQVFAPRGVALPGMERALRSIVAGVASGKPDYAAMSPEFAALARQQLPQWEVMVRPLGEIKSIEFLGPVMPAGDLFEVTFASGTLQIGVALGPDGKIVDSRMRPSPPGG